METRGAPGPPAIRLTGRGAICGLFIVSFLALLLVNWTGWTAVGDFAFIAGCAAAAWFTRPGSLLAVTIAPPTIYFAACLTAELITASGMFGTLTGLLVSLGASAPWLFVGTAITIGIATFRGLPEEVSDLVADMRGR